MACRLISVNSCISFHVDSLLSSAPRIPISKLVPIAMSYFRNFRPGACQALPGIMIISSSYPHVVSSSEKPQVSPHESHHESLAIRNAVTFCWPIGTHQQNHESNRLENPLRNEILAVPIAWPLRSWRVGHQSLLVEPQSRESRQGLFSMENRF